MLKVKPAFSADGTYTTITESDLYDVSDNVIGQGTTQEQGQARTELAEKGGWLLKLENPGEKVLATSTTINGELFFTTYEPKPSQEGCLVSAGLARLYRVNKSDATPTLNFDDGGTNKKKLDCSDCNELADGETLNKSDRSTNLNNSLTLGGEVTTNTGISNTSGLVAGEVFNIDNATVLRRTFWYEQ
jgi:type IV pilus assembly protein PilY1